MSAANNPFTVCNRVSDDIVDIFNRELDLDKENPTQLLMGWLLAFQALEATIPPSGRPPVLTELNGAVDRCLTSLRAYTAYKARK